MVPMRSVPHRVVCLLGLDDGVFPRAVGGRRRRRARPPPADRRARPAQRGPPADARRDHGHPEHLVVTYSGANETTASRGRPPVPLGELLDALDDTVTGGRAHALRAAPAAGLRREERSSAPGVRPLQLPTAVPFSFDRRRWRVPAPPCATASRSVAGRPRRCPPQPADDLELAVAGHLLPHPVRAFLRDRLGVALRRRGRGGRRRTAGRARRPRSSGASATGCCATCCAGRTPDQALGTEWRRGVLPPGRLGWRLGQQLADRGRRPVAEMVESVTQGQAGARGRRRRRPRWRAGGCAAPSPACTTTGSSARRFSRLGPRQWLEAWIPLLALCATHPGPPVVGGAIGRGEKGATVAGRPGRADRLRQRRRRRRPAARPGRDLRRRHVRAAPAPAARPVMPGRARRRPGNARFAARKDAEFKWLSDRFPGENDDDAARRACGVRTPRSTCCWAAPLPGEEYDGADHPPRRPRLRALASPMLERRPLMIGAAWRPSTSLGDRCPQPVTTVLEASAGTGKTFDRRRAGRPLRRRGRRHARRDAGDHLRPRRQPGAARAGPRAARRGRARAGRPGAARARRTGRAARPPSTTPTSTVRRKRLVDALADFDARHDRDHPPVLPAGAALARGRRRHRLAAPSSSRASTTWSSRCRRPLPAPLRLGSPEPPPFKRAVALAAGPGGGRRPAGRARARRRRAGQLGRAPRSTFARDVRAEVERRKRRRGVLSYDDLLSRLADALRGATTPRPASGCASAGRSCWSTSSRTPTRCSGRCSTGRSPAHATLVLIGDPKQAIYAFRGGDVVTYLEAAATAATRQTLATNWRSDAPLVDALQGSLLGGASSATRGSPCTTSAAHHQRSRLVGAPAPHPLRLRLLAAPTSRPARRHRPHRRAPRAHRPRPRRRRRPAARLRRHVRRPAGRCRRRRGADLQPQARRACSGRRSPPAASPRSSAAAAACCSAEAGDDWLALLEALEQPHRRRVRAVALTSFVGETAEPLDAGGDALTDDVAERVRSWLDLFRTRGVAAVHEAVAADGLPGRVLARPDGERLLTDLDHLGQVLHEAAAPRAARAARPCSSGCATSAATRSRPAERTRRLDTDAARRADRHHPRQQGPAVPRRLPAALLRLLRRPTTPSRSSTTTRARTLDVGGAGRPTAARAGPAEDAGEELRLTYVALTRAQSQVVTWWAPSRNAANSGLTRLLFGRTAGEAAVPDRVAGARPTSRRSPRSPQWQARGALRARGGRARRRRRRCARASEAGRARRTPLRRGASTPTGGARRTPG